MRVVGTAAKTGKFPNLDGAGLMCWARLNKLECIVLNIVWEKLFGRASTNENVACIAEEA